MFVIVAAIATSIAAAGCTARREVVRDPALTLVRGAPDPDVVRFDGAVGDRFVRAGTPGEVLARLRIDTRAIERATRPAVNLALVLDTSGSMEGDAIRDARAAALALVDALAPGDRLAVVTFDSTTRVLFPSTRLDATSLSDVRARIGRITARGTTDLAGGLRAGIAEVSRGVRPDGINRIVLMSDGVPNDATPVLALADQAARGGVSITSLGLGLDYDEVLMGAIAQRSGGRYHFVKSGTEVAQVFRDEVLRLKRVVARNLVLALGVGPGVTVRAVTGAGGVAASTSVALGDLADGEQREIVVRLATPARRDGAVVELLDATLTFDDEVVRAGRCRRQLFLATRTTTSEAELRSGHDPEIERAALRAQAAVRIVDAVAAARAGQVVAARELLDTIPPDPGVAALRTRLERLPRVPTQSPSPADEEAVRAIHDSAMRIVLGNGM